MRFLADAMLGKLARWLRIIGYDTEYMPHGGDEELVLAAEREGRTILTRDGDLYRRAVRRGVSALLLKSTNLKEELAEISRAAGLSLSGQTRCPLCNRLLIECPASGVDGGPRPPLWRCPGCGKLYWHGTHWLKINEVLEASGIR